MTPFSFLSRLLLPALLAPDDGAPAPSGGEPSAAPASAPGAPAAGDPPAAPAQSPASSEALDMEGDDLIALFEGEGEDDVFDGEPEADGDRQPGGGPADSDDDESDGDGPDDDPDGDDPDGDDPLAAFMDLDDPLELGDVEEEGDGAETGTTSEGDGGQPKAEVSADAEEQPAAGTDAGPAELPEAFLARLREASPDAVLDTTDAVVERYAAVNEANREMRELQDRLDAAFQANPALEAVVEALIAGPGEGETAPGLLELLGRHVAGVEIEDPDYVADPVQAARQAEQKGRLAAYREQQAAKERARAKYLEDYQGQVAQDFEAFAAETFGEDADAKGRFRQAVIRFEQGDRETGRLMQPRAKLALIHRGLTYDRAVAEAHAKGLAEGRQQRAARRQNGAPKLGGGGRAPQTAPDPLGIGSAASAASIHDQF